MTTNTKLTETAAAAGWTITSNLAPTANWLGTRMYRDNADGTRDEAYATFDTDGKWNGMSLVEGRTRIASSGDRQFGYGRSVSVARLSDALARLA